MKNLFSKIKQKALTLLKNPKARMTCAVLVAVLVTAGTFLIVSPSRQKSKALDVQSALITSITEGSGQIIIDESLLNTPLDFYDEPDEFEDEPIAPSTTVNGIGVLSIEKIGLRLPVADGVSKAKLKVAAGWVPQTSEIGTVGNALVLGHRSYTYGQFFNRLNEIEIGDEIVFEPKDGIKMIFVADSITTVEPDDPSVFDAIGGQSTLTLLTCTPVRKATHRLVIRAKLMEDANI